jgi:hypothetical protein
MFVGCANQMVWYNPGKSQQQFHAENAECLAMGSSAAGSQQIIPTYPTGNPTYNAYAQGWNMGSAIKASNTRDQIYNDCMMGRGWSYVSKASLGR